MKKTTLDISGMHCASCSAIIGKALDKNQSILKQNVNIATNKATIEYNEKEIDLNKIIKIIESKGFGAKESSGKIDFDKESKKKKQEYSNLKKRFYFSLLFAFPVFILGMFFMGEPMMPGLPFFGMIPYQTIIMWLLATPVQFIAAWPMYRSAFSALKGKTANMDTLIVMGTSAAYFYSIYVILKGGMHVYFEASAVLITIVIFGRLLEATRDEETNLRVLGKNTFNLKYKAMMISGFFAGVAGSLYAHYLTYIDPSAFYLPELIIILTIVIIGGLASIKGTIVATVILVILPELIRFIPMATQLMGPVRQIIYALVLILILIFRPRGIFGRVDLR